MNLCIWNICRKSERSGVYKQKLLRNTYIRDLEAVSRSVAGVFIN